MACEIDKTIEQFKTILSRSKTTDVQRKLVTAALGKLESLVALRDNTSNESIVEQLAKVDTARVVEGVKPYNKTPLTEKPQDYKQLKSLKVEVFGKYEGSGLDTGQYYKGMRKVVMKLIGPEIKRSTELSAVAIKNIIMGQPAVAAEYLPYSKIIQFNRISGEQIKTEVDSRLVKAVELGALPAVESTPELSKKYVDMVSRVLRSNQNDHTVVHELIHAGSFEFMREFPDHPATVRVNELFELAKANITKTVNFNYWKTSTDEFLAEALSNPQLIGELIKLEPTAKLDKLSNVFETLVDTLLKMLGLKGKELTNAFEYMLDGYISMVEAQQAQDKRSYPELEALLGKLDVIVTNEEYFNRGLSTEAIQAIKDACK